MATELEIKFLNIDPDFISKRIKLIGGKYIYSKLFRITVFHSLSGIDGEYLRVRDEGNGVTLTYKKTFQSSMLSEEYEVSVSSYEDTIELLKVMGLTLKRNEEKYRIRYTWENAYLDIDYWPNVPPYLEIEAPDEDTLQKVSEKLNLSYDEKFIGTAHDVFYFYGIDPSKFLTLIFDDSIRQKLSIEGDW